MITLNNLPKTVQKQKKVLGRGPGSGLGKNAGKGNKGQTKRGGKRPVYFTGATSDAGQSALARSPKLRGFKARVNKQHAVVQLKTILENYTIDETVNLETLIAKLLVNAKVKTIKVIKTNGLKPDVSLPKFDENDNLVLSKGVKDMQ